MMISTDFEARKAIIDKLGGNSATLTSIFQCELVILALYGGDPRNASNIFEADKLILSLLGGDPTKVNTVFEARKAIITRLGGSTIGISNNYEASLAHFELAGGETPDITYYSVVFKNWNGTILYTTNVIEGHTPIYNGNIPTRPSDGQYNYTFNGWTPSLGPVYGNIEYTASYTATEIPVEPVYYTVVFKNWDGTILQTSSVEEGQTAVYNGSTPARPSDDQYDYTFNGWLPSLGPVNENIEYTALYTATAIPVEPDEPFIPTGNYVTFTAQADNSTIGLKNISSGHSLEYCTANNKEWTAFDTTTTITLNNIGDATYIRGLLNNDLTNDNYTQFKMTGSIAADGNTNSLWNYNNLNAALKYRCGNYLFSKCVSLIKAPDLPATTLTPYCYSFMFSGCTNLTAAPALPATTIADWCYNFMFQNCTNLTAAPALPATNLVVRCYNGMFQNCTNLTAAPELAAQTIADYSYRWMFQGCSKLNSITCLATNISATNCLEDWVSNVASSGTFTRMANVEWPTGQSGIPTNWTVNVIGEETPTLYTITFEDWNGVVLQTLEVEEGQTPVYTGSTPTRPTDELYNYSFNGWTPSITPATANATYTASYTATAIPVEPQAANYVTFTAEKAGSTIGLNKLGSAHTLECSTDTQSWQSMTTATTITLQNINDKVYVRGILNGSLSDMDYTNFKMTGKIAASGNCNTLWNYEAPEDSIKRFAGAYLFRNCTSLTTAPDLPATTLAYGCYYYMFSGCTSLTTAPDLPATGIAQYCCYYMFFGCTSLTAAPELPATTLASYCYASMFNGCTSLTTAPDLPATNLAENCYYNMFRGCTSLTTVPTTLPARLLTAGCYNAMFSGCTSLTTAPELSGVQLGEGSYNSMFEGCTSLTTAPALAATTLAPYCYSWMFDGCTKLSTIKCLATNISATGALKDWTKNVASTGTFYKATGVEWPTGTAGIPEGWTVVEV